MRFKSLLSFFIVFLLFFSIHSYAAGEAKLVNVKLSSSDPQSLRFVFVVNKQVDYDAFVLPNPDRLVIDFKKTLDSYKLDNIDTTNTPIKNIRHGIRNGYDLRVVFDLNQKLHVNSFVLPFNKDEKGWRLVVDATGGKAGAIKAGIENQVKAQIQTETVAPATTTPSVPVTSTTSSSVATVKTTKAVTKTATTIPASAPAVTSVTTASTSTQNLPPRDVIVVIDAGHGGKDPGTIGPGGVKEKNVTLAIAKDLQQLVNATPGMKAAMTRNGDYYVGLRQRLAIARQDHGDLFIAIHADAFKAPDATGAAVFALSLHGASSEAARWVAQKENYSELGGVNLNQMPDQSNLLRWVLIDLSQAATIKASVDFGSDVIRGLSQVTQLHYPSVQQAPFMVLKSPDIPSILVETGFLSNPYEEARLKTPAYQHKIAQALMYGINQYFHYHAPPNTIVAINEKKQNNS